MTRVLGGRLPPSEMFPAGRAGYEVRWLTLPGGLRTRVLACEPGDRGAVPNDMVPNGEAPVAVFVHGWACSAYTWHRNLRVVADAGARVYAYDLKGHGLTDKPLADDEYTVPAMARQLRDVLDALGLRRVLLVGHSMGCAISLRLAIDAPERVAGMVLVAPVGFGVISDMKLLRWLTPRPVELVLPYIVPRWAFRVALWRAYGRIGHATARDVDEYYAPSQDPAFIRVLCRLSHTFDWTEGSPDELSHVRCPTSVLFGERDHLVHADASRPFVDCLPHATVEVVKDAGHTVPEEVPTRVNEVVLRAVRATAAETVSSSLAPRVTTG